MPRIIPRPHIHDLTLAVPPSIPEPDAVLSTSTRRLNLNEAPIPPSPKTLAAMTQALTDVSKYPDHNCTALSQMLSGKLGVPEDRLFFGGGSGELLQAAAFIAVGPGDEVVVPVPTFPNFGNGVQLANGQAIGIPVNAQGENDVRGMVDAITPNTQVVYACTPNNPTGGLSSRDDIVYLAKSVPSDVLLLVDEAYQEFAAFDGGPDCLQILSERDGLWISTRTFSKAYSLAGMRVGYGVASSTELAQAFWKVRGNFTVNRVAIAGAHAAYMDIEYQQAYLAENARQRTRISDGLKKFGFDPYPTSANFVTAKSPEPTDALMAHLLAQNIMIQALTWPGAGPCLRVSVGSNDDTNALLSAIETFLNGNP